MTMRISRPLRFPFAVAGLVGLAVLGAVRPGLGYTLSGGGVWDIPNSQRIAYNPAAGAIGNMGTGAVYNVAAAPAGAQAGAAGQATAACTTGDGRDTLFTRINLVSGVAGAANVPLTWDPPAGLGGAPGLTTNAAVNFNPRNIMLDNTRTLRTDRWSLDFAGTRPDLIDEYDVYTTAVHEIGHSLGLGHPGTANVVMTPQDTARQNAAGSWRAIEQTTPFAGQPLNLSGAALANGTLAYQDPRAALAADDISGVRTLYSAPILSLIARILELRPHRFKYFYTLINRSDSDADYFTHEIIIPVPSTLKIGELMLEPPPKESDLGRVSGAVPDQLWQFVRTEAGIALDYMGTGGLGPQSALSFSFEADAGPVMVTPRARWGMLGLELGLPGAGDLSDQDDPNMLPAFDPRDFAVLDGSFTYALVGEVWQTVPLGAIPAPGNVPAPPAWVLLLFGGVSAVLRRTRRSVPGTS